MKKFQPFDHKPRNYMQRRVNTITIRQRFLIVCEGEKTEPYYFRNFHPAGKVIDVKGIGANTTSLVREALRVAKEGRYDQVWCVLDRDSFPAQNFNQALQLAKANGFQVAYSNEAFELWYLLHFEYRQSAMHREEYKAKISEYLHHPYQKNDPAMFDQLLGCQKDALRNAQRLLDAYDPPDPVNDNPSTTVHLLVKQLNQPLWQEE